MKGLYHWHGFTLFLDAQPYVFGTGSFLTFDWLIFNFDNFTYLCCEFHSCVIIETL